jgi:hypothetical protein
MARFVARYRRWAARHPWRELLLIAALFALLLLLLPPRDSLGAAVAKTAGYFALILALNYLRYRSVLPTPERIREAEAETDRIEARVRERQDVDLSRW